MRCFAARMVDPTGAYRAVTFDDRCGSTVGGDAIVDSQWTLLALGCAPAGAGEVRARQLFKSDAAGRSER
jgi:hypothetical protein